MMRAGSELIELHGLVSCGKRLVVPRLLRRDMLSTLHSSHCKILYWHEMSAEIRDFVSRCTICQTYRPAQAHEELHPHQLLSRPWEKIAADLFVIGQQTFLIIVDYWSNYFEVAEIHNKTSQAVIMRCKVQFACMEFLRFSINQLINPINQSLFKHGKSSVKLKKSLKKCINTGLHDCRVGIRYVRDSI